MTIASVTGHRPEKLTNIEWVRAALEEVLNPLNISALLTGMASGVDLIAAQIALDKNIDCIAVKPWAGHKARIGEQNVYNLITTQAKKVINVEPTNSYPGVWVYHKRNQYMVDNSDILIAVWDGGKEGGTAACVRYAEQVNKPIIWLNPIQKTFNLPSSPADTTLF